MSDLNSWGQRQALANLAAPLLCLLPGAMVPDDSPAQDGMGFRVWTVRARFAGARLSAH